MRNVEETLNIDAQQLEVSEQNWIGLRKENAKEGESNAHQPSILDGNMSMTCLYLKQNNYEYYLKSFKILEIASQ